MPSHPTPTFSTWLPEGPHGRVLLTHARSSREGGPATGAAVVIAPSAFGVTDDLRAQMAELTEVASEVVTFDPCFTDDVGPLPYDDLPRVMARLRKHDPEHLYGHLRFAIGCARELTRLGHGERGRPVVVVGVCFGGPFALRAAADGLADGVVTWHGTGLEAMLARADDMRCPMRHHFGSADPLVPPPAVDAVRAAFAGREDVRVVVHRGATHGFTHRDAARAYDPVAERAAMASVRELVERASPPR